MIGPVRPDADPLVTPDRRRGSGGRRPGAITFVTPHQRRTSGGVQVIEQLAAGLARDCAVRLVVLDAAELHPVPGVEVLAARRPLFWAFPSADVLVIPGDSTRGRALLRLPPRVGRPVLLVQSWSTPNGTATRENLARVGAAIAVSPWLAGQARATGARVELVRPAVDDALFHAPAGRAQRGRRVTMLLHSAPAKGGRDGLSAIRAAAAHLRGTELHLFGTGIPTGLVAAREVHHGPLAPAAVADLLRRTAVFVNPSWEEGLGLPGIEALLCGAALATTDTGGGGDYAIDRSTALVSPPHAPADLAENVAELLADRQLRARLARAGGALARERYGGGWPRAAAELQDALATL